LGQIRSTILHRIPHSMVWNSSIFQKNNKWFYLFNTQISSYLLNSFLYFSYNTSQFNWYWRDTFISYLTNITKCVNNTSPLTVRFSSILNNPNKRQILSNTNNWSNTSIQGKLNFFDVNNNLYCLNTYYLQNFTKFKKLKFNKTKIKFLHKYNTLYQTSKIITKILQKKIKFKIKKYKTSIKLNYFLNFNITFIFKSFKFNMLLKNLNFKKINTVLPVYFKFFLKKNKLKQYFNLNNYLQYSSNLFCFFEDLNSNFFLEILYL